MSSSSSRPPTLPVFAEWKDLYTKRVLDLFRQMEGKEFIFSDFHPDDDITNAGWNWIQNIDLVQYRTAKGEKAAKL